MSSNHKGPKGMRLRLWLILVCLSLSFSLPAAEQIKPDGTEIWLVTYGPGEIYWQRFGHNAIWVRDAGFGLDHVFNFGFFDFGQEDFFLRFLQGRMLYFSAARPAREEFASYIDENRGIRAQRLDLAEDQKLRLIDYLLEEVQLENRDYLYDYYANNCSTRVRDAIDLAMEGALKEELQAARAKQSRRDETRRLTSADFWLYLGLEAGLGSPVDRSISRWDETFIPSALADAIASFRYPGLDVNRPLVLEDVVLYESSFEPPPASPGVVWPRYLLASLGLLLACWLVCRAAPARVSRLLPRFWLVLSGLAGFILVYLWVGTDHSVTRLNLNLLVFCPGWILLPFLKGWEKTSFMIVSGLSALALVMTVLPPHQYTLDVLAAFLPLNLAAALALFRNPKSPAETPGVPASAVR